MALMTISDTDISGVLKTMYSGFREELFPMSTPLLAQVKRGKAGGPRNLRWGGEGVKFDAVLSRPLGMTGSASGWLPPHAQATEKHGTLGIKRLYVTREIDGLAVVGTQSKESAFISLAKKVLEEAKDAATLGMQEILHGNGRAIKALVTSVTDTDTIVVSSPYGVSGAGEGGLLLDAGQYIAVLDASDSFVTVLGRAFITSVTNSGDSATLELASTIASMAAGDAIVAATTEDTSLDAFPDGLISITNRGNAYGTIHGITHARFDAIRMTAGTDTTSTADDPNEQDVWRLIAKVAGRSGKDARLNPNQFLLLTTPGLEEKLANSFYGQRRLTPSDFVNLKGGFKAITICGVPVVSDCYCPAGTIYLVHIPSLVWVDAKDWGQIQYQNAGAWRWITGRDAFQINWGAYMNFGVLNRGAVGSIVGYTDTVRYGFVV